jgi:hypothetical protein
MSPHQGGAVSVLCFIAQAGRLAREVKSGHIDKYDVSSYPKEFIQIYHTVI